MLFRSVCRHIATKEEDIGSVSPGWHETSHPTCGIGKIAGHVCPRISRCMRGVGRQSAEKQGDGAGEKLWQRTGHFHGSAGEPVSLFAKGSGSGFGRVEGLRDKVIIIRLRAPDERAGRKRESLGGVNLIILSFQKPPSSKQIALSTQVFFSMPAEGIEPTHSCEYQILSLARLPIPPRRLCRARKLDGMRMHCKPVARADSSRLYHGFGL